MSVLVTGGAGYIGSHAVWECIDNGEDVVVVDNLISGFDWAVPKKVPLIAGDVADRGLIGNLIEQYDVDSIMHFAGSVVVPESLEKPLKYYHNNTAKTRTLLETAVRCGVDKFIFSSSAAVYAAPPSLKPIGENAPLAPMTPYGQSKLMSEIMLRDAARAHGLRYVILRYFNVAGADPEGRTGLSTRGATHVMKLACEAAIGKREEFTIYGSDYETRDGTAIRDFIHVSDLANAHYVALKFLRVGGQMFTGNAGYSTGYTVQEVIDTVKRVSGADFEVKQGPRRQGDIPAIVADASRMMSRLDWKPKYNSLEKIVTDALAWEHILKKRQHNVPPLSPDEAFDPAKEETS